MTILFRSGSFNCLKRFVASLLTNKFVTIRLPRGWLLGGGVKLVVEQTKGLLTAESVPGKQRTVASREIDFYIHAVRRTSLYERRPQPIVYVGVRYVAHNITPPIDALVEVCKRLLHPLWNRLKGKKITLACVSVESHFFSYSRS